MNTPDSVFQILRLTDDFFNSYPNPPYTEILKKKQRAYKCVLFQTHYDYFICIPFRSEMTHHYGYRFKNSARSASHKSGVDYTKIVIISKTEYIDSNDAIIDHDEYTETMINSARIKNDALIFVEDYVAHIKGVKKLHPREFQRRYSYSPLKYFHNELGV